MSIVCLCQICPIIFHTFLLFYHFPSCWCIRVDILLYIFYLAFFAVIEAAFVAVSVSCVTSSICTCFWNFFARWVKDNCSGLPSSCLHTNRIQKFVELFIYSVRPTVVILCTWLNCIKPAALTILKFPLFLLNVEIYV